MSTGPLTAVTSIVRSTNCGDLKSTKRPAVQSQNRMGGGGRDDHGLPEFTNMVCFASRSKRHRLIDLGAVSISR